MAHGMTAAVCQKHPRMHSQPLAQLLGWLIVLSHATQATLFNKPRTGFNVMSASDAVGMGLNLNIR